MKASTNRDFLKIERSLRSKSKFQQQKWKVTTLHKHCVFFVDALFNSVPRRSWQRKWQNLECTIRLVSLVYRENYLKLECTKVKFKTNNKQLISLGGGNPKTNTDRLSHWNKPFWESIGHFCGPFFLNCSTPLPPIILRGKINIGNVKLLFFLRPGDKM